MSAVIPLCSSRGEAEARLAVVQKPYHAHLARHVKKASKSLKRLRTLARRQVRDLSRKLERVGQLGVYENFIVDGTYCQAREEVEREGL